MFDCLLVLYSLAIVQVAIFFAPCQCCTSTGCTIASDAFTTDDLATAWDVRTGSPTISGGKLNADSGTTLLIHNTAAGASATGVFASVEFTATSTTDYGRLIIAYTDDSNYWFLEAQPGATNGTLKLYERSAGTNTQRGATQTVSGWTTATGRFLRLCYANGVVRANCSPSTFGGGGGGAASVSYAATITIASTKAGLGANEVGAVTFDNFSFEKHNYEQAGCNSCSQCSRCTDGFMPDQVQVEVSGFTTGDGDGGGCPDSSCIALNATYILDSFPSSSCCWYLLFNQPSLGCNYKHALLTLGPSGATLTFDIAEALTSSSDPCAGVIAGSLGFDRIHWEKSSPSVNCLQWSAYDLNTTKSRTVSGSSFCNGVAHTSALVTSL